MTGGPSSLNAPDTVARVGKSGSGPGERRTPSAERRLGSRFLVVVHLGLCGKPYRQSRVAEV